MIFPLAFLLLAAPRACPPAPRPVPAPMVSRGKPVRSNGLMADGINDGLYRNFRSWWTQNPSPKEPSWVAIDIGAGPTRLLAIWTASANFNLEQTTYGGPGSYRLETSADSTNGKNGTWRTAATVTDNKVRTRSHVVEFAGQRWLRLSILGPSPTTNSDGVRLDELDVHDLSRGGTDTWFFLGDSITAMAFDRMTPSHQPSFQELLHTRHQAFFPAQINGGSGFLTLDHALPRLDDWLALSPGTRYWAVALGTNDASGHGRDTAAFRSRLEELVRRLLAAGKVPVLAQIPYAADGQHDSIPEFNKVIAQVEFANCLTPGPDLYSWFLAHPDHLQDKLHPDDEGMRAINRLWAQAVDKLYPR
jgi:acyl-CoA thioesterase-1